MKIEWALISVSNKDGLIELAQELCKLGIHCLSTGGTAKTLEAEGVEVTTVSEYTGFPEILDGRVKTLHPRIHAGILACYEKDSHVQVIQEHEILPLGLVIVNLYPFVETVSRGDITLAEATEQIDIGGPTMIRAGAKNASHITVVVDPSDYSAVVDELRDNGGQTLKSTRMALARKAFEYTSNYDTAIASYLQGQDKPKQEMPVTVSLSLARQDLLRYGENPHQRAAIYQPLLGKSAGFAKSVQIQGKQLSFNNYLDLESAWRLVAEFDKTCCAIVKHNNPCGVAVGTDLQDAYAKAFECDPVSAFGSIVAFNRPVDSNTAEAMRSLFVEAVIGPSYSPEALEIFSRKKNLRLMRLGLPEPGMHISGSSTYDLKKISGAYLIQELDVAQIGIDDVKVLSERLPEPAELEDLIFAWTIAKHVKSNAIVFARNRQTLGIGAGQMSRIDSVLIATQKANVSLDGAVMASDAFFPFRDCVDEAAKSGIRAVIQPGGSVRDQEVVLAADEHHMVMVVTGIRHFRH